MLTLSKVKSLLRAAKEGSQEGQAESVVGRRNQFRRRVVISSTSKCFGTASLSVSAQNYGFILSQNAGLPAPSLSGTGQSHCRLAPPALSLGGSPNV
jgi:hypothetical protein